MIVFSSSIDQWIDNVSISELTIFFLIIVIFAATQDIAVDGLIIYYNFYQYLK